ncbi:MAG: SURF1 family protein [Gemmobacter sp.]
MVRLIGAIVIGVAGCAVLVALGIWQVQRLEWKGRILSDIAARIEAAPAPLPARPDAEADRYLPVAVEGAFDGAALAILISVKGEGPGFRLVAAFETAQGRRVLVDRGFIPEALRAATPPATGPARIEGNLHWPDEVDSYTPPPDAARGIWFARDLPAMAEALGTEPVLIVARRAEPADAAVRPLPLDTATIPNNHLQYAITWFSLAAVWAGMTALFVWRIRRRTA